MYNLVSGLSMIGSGSDIAFLIGGALIGVLVGVIPGLSTVVVLSIILVFVYRIDLTGTLCLFLGAQCGSFYAASVSAILLNTPSHPEAFPITLDGYPMARQGQPGRALGLSACSTCIGGIIGCAILVGFLQVINDFGGIFHPPEYVALVALAMVLTGTLGTDSVGKAIAAAGGGLVLSSVGPSAITGTFRYTFGAVGLQNGVSLVALVLGIFAIPQMVMVFGTGTTTAAQDMTGREIEAAQQVSISAGYGRELLAGVLETFRYWGVLLQSGIVGGVSGIVPGIGGFTGNLMAYSIAKQVSRKRDSFGTGVPEGIIAPEGSSLAKEAGHIIPIIGLGIPGGVAGALFIGALSIKGVQTGYGFQQAYPGVSGEIVWIIALSGLIGTVAGVLIGPQIARVTRIPGPLIVPFIFAMCVSGPFFSDSIFFAVVELLVFGVVGLALRRLRYPLGAFILGVVLGPTFETNLYLTHNIYPGVSWVAHRPLADAIFTLCLAVLVLKARALRRERAALTTRLAPGDQLAVPEVLEQSDPFTAGPPASTDPSAPARYPLLSLCATVVAIAVSLYVVVYGLTNYNFATGLMPEIGAVCVALPTLLFLPGDIRQYYRYRKAKGTGSAIAPALIRTRAGPARAAAGSRTPAPQFAGGVSSLAEPGSLRREIEPATLAGVTVSPGARFTIGRVAPIARLAGRISARFAAPSPAIIDKSWARQGQYRRELAAFAWLLGLVAACWLIGFDYGSAVFMTCYGLISTRRYFAKFHWQMAFTLLSACVVWLLLYEMFQLAHLVTSPVITL